jgi:predicted nucleic-acid-binding Zn-ribbon protein
MARNESCPKCSGNMHEGFIADRFDNIHRVVSTWTEGAPQKTFWTGLRLKGRKTRDVQTLRCDKCGFLESYAK